MNFESIGKKIDDIDVTISSRIIELFSAGLYSSPNKAFEELICNSYDAFASKVAVLIIMIRVQTRKTLQILMIHGWKKLSQ